MTDITTKVDACIRYVLIRNVDCEKYTRDPSTYTTRTHNVSSKLTARGEKMAQALSCLIDYMEARKYCLGGEDAPSRKYNIIVDNRTSEHSESAKYLIKKHNEVPVFETDNIDSVVQNNLDKEYVNVFIVFTGTTTIRKMFNIGDNYLVGPALGSTTIYDVPFDSEKRRIFVHHCSSLAVIQYGGCDTTENYWWNNSA